MPETYTNSNSNGRKASQNTPRKNDSQTETTNTVSKSSRAFRTSPTTCIRPEKMSHLVFEPRCDILEYLFCKRRERVMKGGGVTSSKPARRHTFKMCEYGTLQFKGTCYYNAFVNGILLNQTLAYHAYAKMFEYIAGTFIPNLSLATLSKMERLVDVIDPSRCSLKDNLDFFMMLHAFFCNYDRLIDARPGIDYHEYVIRNLHRQGSIQNRTDHDKVEGGNPFRLVEPVLGKKLQLTYKNVSRLLLQQETIYTRTNVTFKVPEVLIVREAKIQRFSVSIVYLLKHTSTAYQLSRQSKKSNQITGKQLFDDLETLMRDEPRSLPEELIYTIKAWKEAGVGKDVQINMYEFVIDVIRQSAEGEALTENAHYKTIRDALSRYDAKQLLQFFDEAESLSKDKLDDIVGTVVDCFTAFNDLYDIHASAFPDKFMVFNPILLKKLPAKLPSQLSFMNATFTLAYGCISIGFRKKSVTSDYSGHAMVGTICNGRPIVCDSNIDTLLDIDWTDKILLEASMNKHVKYYRTSLGHIGFDHIAYIRDDLEARSIEKIRALHNEFLGSSNSY